MTEGNTALLDGIKRVITTKSPKYLPEIRRGRTELGIVRIKKAGKYRPPDNLSPKGYFIDRPIIGQDTPINGGVYLGGEGREAIVVDDRIDEYLVKAHETLRNRITRLRGQKIDDLRILREVYNLTKQTLPFDERRAENLAARFDIDQKVTLGRFIQEKAGVCRHQSLLGAYFLEKLKGERFLNGKVSIDRNSIGILGSHAWARYTDKQGEVYILDATKDFVGRLKDPGASSKWTYTRSNERA